jgi:O-antigen/teichoic acid export membrane protein
VSNDVFMTEKTTTGTIHIAHSLKKNITANFAGTIWQALMGILFIPLYIKFLGIESWGLIGIFATLQGIFSLLDLGLTGTLNRELARLSVLPQKEQEMRNLVRTLEILYWSVAAFVGIAIIALSPFIAGYWIKSGSLSSATVEQALVFMGIITAFQMPGGFYSGGLMGLQKQVKLNGINIGVSTVRGAGAVLILWLISPTIQAFFLWQILTSIVSVFLIGYSLWHALPVSDTKGVFQKVLLHGVWRFAAGMSGITILGIVLTQLDKIILSKMLTLEMFGYYMLAGVVAMSLGRLFTPVFYSIYPRLTQLVSINNQEELIRLYHKSCQFFAVLILPAAIVLSFFSYEVILLWTQNPVTAEKTHLIVSIMIFGTALNGLVNPPYALQLAYGWTKLPFYVNLVSVVLFVPLIILLATYFGAIGGAIAWLVLNMGFILVWIPVMHQRLLRTEQWRWYWQDVFVPLITGVVVAGIGRLIVNQPYSQMMMVLELCCVSVITLGMTALSMPVTRAWMFEQAAKISFGQHKR